MNCVVNATLLRVTRAGAQAGDLLNNEAKEDGVNGQKMQVVTPETKIEAFKSKVDTLVESAKGLVIRDDLSRGMVVEVFSSGKRLKTALEKDRKLLVDPQRRIINFINDGFRPLRERCEAVIEDLDLELKRDRIEQERIAREAREQAERIAQIAQKKIDDAANVAAEEVAEVARKEALEAGFNSHDAKALGVMEGEDAAVEVQNAAPPPSVIPPPAPAKTVTVASESGQVSSATFKKVWDFEVEDVRKVHQLYLEVRSVAVREWMRAYVKANGTVPEHPPEMPGIRFFQRTDVAGGR